MEKSNLRLSAVISADVSQFTAAFKRITRVTKEAGGKISASAKQFSAKVSASFKEMSGKMKAAGDKMESVGKNLSLKVSLPIAALGTTAVMSAVKFEVLQKSLDVLTGSAEKGAEAFNKIKAFSAATPFQLDDLVQVNNMLIGFGLTADDSFDALKRLSDISAVTGANLSRMSVAFGQSAGMGRVMTQDLNQFVNNGVPIYKLLTEVTGKNTAELRDMAAAGELTFDILESGIKKATSAGGLFFEGTEQLSRTLGGRLSTLKDNFNLMMSGFGDVMGEVIKPLTLLLTETFKYIGKMSDSTKRWVVATAALVAGIGPLLAALGIFVGTILPAMIVGFGALSSPITLIIAAIAALAASILYIWDNWKAIKERISDTSWWTNTLISMAQFLIKYNPIQLLLEPLLALLKLVGIDVPNAFNLMAGALDSLRSKTTEYTTEFGSFTDALKNGAKAAFSVMKELTGIDEKTKEVIKSVSTATGKVKDFKLSLEGLHAISQEQEEGEKLYKPIDKMNESVTSAINLVQGGLTGAFTQFFTTLSNGGENPFQSIIDFLKRLVIRLLAAAAAAFVLSGILSALGFGAMAGTSVQALFASMSGLNIGGGGVDAPNLALANGGIVSGPTNALIGEYAGAGTNPEVVAPLNKLKSMIGVGSGETIIKGSDLLVIMKRAMQEEGRI